MSVRVPTYLDRERRTHRCEKCHKFSHFKAASDHTELFLHL